MEKLYGNPTSCVGADYGGKITGTWQSKLLLFRQVTIKVFMLAQSQQGNTV